MSRELRRNASGAKDPTAYAALKPIVRQDNEIERELHKLIATIKNVVNLTDFELIARIEVKHKGTGKEFR